MIQQRQIAVTDDFCCRQSNGFTSRFQLCGSFNGLLDGQQQVSGPQQATIA